MGSPSCSVLEIGLFPNIDMDVAIFGYDVLYLWLIKFILNLGQLIVKVLAYI